jgi:hypothetical protein
VAEEESTKQKKISEYTASPVRMGLSREVSQGTKDVVNAQVLQKKYGRASQSALAQREFDSLTIS